METEQIMEMLKAMQDKAYAYRKADQEKADADRTTDREKMLAEIRADRQADRELLKGIMDTNTKSMRQELHLAKRI
jgi:hypothetical protein